MDTRPVYQCRVISNETDMNILVQVFWWLFCGHVLFPTGTYLGMKLLGHTLDVLLILISSFSAKLTQSWLFLKLGMNSTHTTGIFTIVNLHFY